MKIIPLSVACSLALVAIPGMTETPSADLQHDFVRQVRVEDGLRQEQRSSGTILSGRSASGSGESSVPAPAFHGSEQERMSAEVKAEIYDRQLSRSERTSVKRRAQGRIPLTPAAFDADSLAADQAREERLDALAQNRLRSH